MRDLWVGWVGARWPNHFTISRHPYIAVLRLSAARKAIALCTHGLGECHFGITLTTQCFEYLLRLFASPQMFWVSLRKLPSLAFVQSIPPIRFILSFYMAESAPRIFQPAQDADPALPLEAIPPAAPTPARISKITEMKRKIVSQSNARVKAVCANGLG